MAEDLLTVKTITDTEIDRWEPPTITRPINSKDISGSVHHVSELLDDVINARFRDQTWIEGFPTTCWPAFNKAFGGLRPGEVTVITAETGNGKTTFALNWAMDYVRPGKNGVFYVSLEMSRMATACKVAQLIQRRPIREFEIETDLQGLKEILANLNFWYFDHYGQLGIDHLRKAVAFAAHEKKTRLVVIDHLGYLIHEKHSETQAIAIGNTMRALTLLARDTQVTILLVVHPAKLHLFGQARPVELDDLKGSSDIKQEASNVLSLFKPDRKGPGTQLFFLKIRCDQFSQSVGGRLRFDFDPRTLWLREISTDIEFSAPGQKGLG